MKNRVLSIIVVLMLAAALALPGANTASAATATMTVVSDTSAMVIDTTGDGTPGTNAVAAWEPHGEEPSYWDAHIDHTFPAEADWIWSTYRTVQTISGCVVTFRKTFYIPGAPAGGTLYITADNGYEVRLNDQLVGKAQVSGTWKNPGALLDQTQVTTDGWQDVENYNVGLLLQAGPNTLDIYAPNERMQDDLDGQYNGDSWTNPAGLIFELNITYEAAGFTHTWGYWKTHSSQGPAPYDDTWAVLGETTPFFLSGTSYYGVLQENVAGGNAYYQLAHQYVAAKLSVLDGAWMRADVQAAFNQATALLALYTPSQIATFKKGDAGQKAIFSQFNQLASILDQYNNGLMGTDHAG